MDDVLLNYVKMLKRIRAALTDGKSLMSLFMIVRFEIKRVHCLRYVYIFFVCRLFVFRNNR